MSSKIKNSRESTVALRRSARQRSKPVTKPPTPVSSEDEDEKCLQENEGKVAMAKFKCSTCGSTFVYRNKYKIHLKTHAAEGHFKCLTCDRSFPSEENLIDHQKRVHQKEKSYICCICNKRCFGYNPFLLHVGTHANDNTNQSPETNESKDEEEEDTIIPFKCSFCGKSFLREQNYNFHLKSHIVKGPYKCPECEKVFSQPWLLRAHHKRFHLKEKAFECSLCDKSFVTNKELKCHVGTHKEKPYKCRKCPEAFCTSNYLTKHMRLHSKDRRYKCPKCEKRFKTSGTRCQHIKTVHTHVGLFKCSFCEKTFPDISRKKKHERTHSDVKPFKCKYCGKMFTSNKWIKKHEFNRKASGISCYKNIIKKTLSGEKSAPSTSKKTFIANQEIAKKPTNTHLKARPFKCSICGKPFHYQTNRNVHEKNHSVEKSSLRLKRQNPSEVRGNARTPGRIPTDKYSKAAATFSKRSSTTPGTRIRRVSRFKHRKRFYPCTTCGKNFVTHEKLKSHRKTHPILMACRVIVMSFA